jgi:hypothetical protein
VSGWQRIHGFGVLIQGIEEIAERAKRQESLPNLDPFSMFYSDF